MYRKGTFLEIYTVTVREDTSLGYGQYPAETGTVGGVLEECHLRAVGSAPHVSRFLCPFTSKQSASLNLSMQIDDLCWSVRLCVI